MEQKDMITAIEQRLQRIYGYQPPAIAGLLAEEAARVTSNRRQKATPWSEQDVILITYGDSIRQEGEQPLATLNTFLDDHLSGSISHVHILPFFPYSSDDGFSVIDYYRVNPELGDWKAVENMTKNYRLMADLVVNHISQHSTWFQNYLKGREPGAGFFIEADPGEDLSRVVRPRSLPLLTPVETEHGKRWVWTTFSDDQIDLNFRNPQVLLEMMKVFLFYMEQGAQIIRLDAIAFLWKEPGTSCLHLPQTHEVVKLMREIMQYVDPNAVLITETNVPNKENLSYFGAGDEAHMVYQFSLPPLLLYALHTADSTYLTRWASTLTEIPEGCTFFNFTASHDGIGVRPLEGLLPDEEIRTLAEAMKSYGGRISTKRNADGSDSPYEMNITYLDALKYTRAGEDRLQTERFICSQTIMMSFKGIPAFYIHSLIGTHNFEEGVAETGMNRTINRRKWDAGELAAKLESDSEHRHILEELSRRIFIRKSIPEFHPDAPQHIWEDTGRLLILERGSEHNLIMMANLSGESVATPAIPDPAGDKYIDRLSDIAFHPGRHHLKPYQVVWLKRK